MESTNNHQFIAFSPIVVHQYRRRSIPTIITDDHINGILEKL
ncbi:unnamed protein product, partial [Rotaria sp. Silwood2]